MLRKNKGITLVALVVTIIVLIILAGVSISLVLGQGGVVQKAKEGRDTYAEAARVENEQLANVDMFTAAIGDTSVPTGTISMTSGDLTVSATINLGDNTDVERTKYVFTTSNAPLGTNDESLYKDGTIESTNLTITKVKSAGTYYLHILAVSKNGFKDEIISEGTATSAGKKDFDYTGKSQTITLTPGNYKLEVWGASGAGNDLNGSAGAPGLGGKSTGTLVLSEPTEVFVYVGQRGSSGYSGWTSYGWNGGGRSYSTSSGDPGSGGGGATDISLQGTADSTTWNETKHLYSRLIVAGGGGGGRRRW